MPCPHTPRSVWLFALQITWYWRLVAGSCTWTTAWWLFTGVTPYPLAILPPQSTTTSSPFQQNTSTRCPRRLSGKGSRGQANQKSPIDRRSTNHSGENWMIAGSAEQWTGDLASSYYTQKLQGERCWLYRSGKEHLVSHSLHLAIGGAKNINNNIKPQYQQTNKIRMYCSWRFRPLWNILSFLSHEWIWLYSDVSVYVYYQTNFLYGIPYIILTDRVLCMLGYVYVCLSVCLSVSF